jgi:hypothetical protein
MPFSSKKTPPAKKAVVAKADKVKTNRRRKTKSTSPRLNFSTYIFRVLKEVRGCCQSFLPFFSLAFGTRVVGSFVRSFVRSSDARTRRRDATRRESNRLSIASVVVHALASRGVGLRHVAIERVGWHPVLARQAAALSSDGSTSRIPPFD